MSKAIEEKINAVKRYLPKCNSLYDCYTYGNIPRDKFNNACMSYAGHMEYEECLGMIDETLFSSGKKGMIFGVNGFYSSSQNGIMLYKDGIQWKSLGDTYNINIMNEMLEKLCEIDTRLSGWDIAGSLLKGAWDWYQENADKLESNNDEEVVETDEEDDTEFFLNTVQQCLDHVKEIQVCVDDALEGDLGDKVGACVEIADILTNDQFEYDGDEMPCEVIVDTMIESITENVSIDGVREIDFAEKTLEIQNRIAELLQEDDREFMDAELYKCFNKYQILLRTVRRTLKAMKDYVEEE